MPFQSSSFEPSARWRSARTEVRQLNAMVSLLKPARGKAESRRASPPSRRPPVPVVAIDEHGQDQAGEDQPLRRVLAPDTSVPIPINAAFTNARNAPAPRRGPSRSERISERRSPPVAIRVEVAQ